MYMKIKRKLTPWLYSMPALILIGMVIVFPIIYTGYISLTNMNLFHWSNYEFIGQMCIRDRPDPGYDVNYPDRVLHLLFQVGNAAVCLDRKSVV